MANSELGSGSGPGPEPEPVISMVPKTSERSTKSMKPLNLFTILFKPSLPKTPTPARYTSAKFAPAISKIMLNKKRQTLEQTEKLTKCQKVLKSAKNNLLKVYKHTNQSEILKILNCIQYAINDTGSAERIKIDQILTSSKKIEKVT